MPQPTFTHLTNGSSTSHPFTSASVTPTANRLIFVTVNAYISTGNLNPGTPTVVGNGITYELVRSQDIDTSGADRATMWVFRGMSAAPSAGTIVVTFTTTIPTRAAWIVDQSDSNVDTTGTNGSGAIVAGTLNGSTSASTVTTQPTSFVGSMTTGNGAFFACGKESNAEGQTPRTNWTELGDEIGTSLVGTETQYLSGAATDTGGSSTWTTAIRAASILVEVKAGSSTTNATVTAAAVHAATAIPAPSVVANADAAVTATAVHAATAVPAPTIVLPDATIAATAVHAATAVPGVTVSTGSYSTLLYFSDPQADGGSGTNTRISDNLTLVRATAYDHVQGGGDYCNNWTTAQQTDFDTRFNVGSLKADTDVVMGNHEYDYNWHNGWDYFGAPLAGPSYTAPWHSYDMPNGWHIVNLDFSNSLASGSTQYTWLGTDLDAHSNTPTLVFLHWGRYSGCSAHGSNTGASDAFALMLTKPWVEALLSGHQHMYERFARMNNAGAVDSTNGIRQFTAPPSGQTTTLTNSSPTGLEFYADSTYSGIMRLQLYSDHYTWETLVPSGYNAIGDSGSQTTRYTIATVTNATVTATAVTAVTAVPTPARTSLSTVTPSAVATVTAVPTPARTSAATVTAGAVLASAAVPTPTRTSAASVTPGAVAGHTAVPTPGRTSDATATCTAVSAVTAVPTPARTSDATVTAATVHASTAVPAASVQAGTTVTVAVSTVGAVTAVPAVTIQADRSTTVTATAVPGAAAVPAPTVTGQTNATVTAAAVHGATVVPSATIGAGAEVAAAALVAVCSVPTPARTSDATVTATAVHVPAAVPTPTVTGATTASVNPAPVAATVVMPAATIIAGTSVAITATAVTAVTAVPTPARTSDATVTATAVATVTHWTTPTVTGATGATITAVPVAAVVTVPVVALGVVISAAAIVTTVAVPTPVRTSPATIIVTAVAGVTAVPAPSVSTTASATVTAVSIGAQITVPQATTLAGLGAIIVAVALAARTRIPGPLIAGIINGTSEATVTGGSSSASTVSQRASSTPGVSGVSDSGVVVT